MRSETTGYFELDSPALLYHVQREKLEQAGLWAQQQILDHHNHSIWKKGFFSAANSTCMDLESDDENAEEDNNNNDDNDTKNYDENDRGHDDEKEEDAK